MRIAVYPGSFDPVTNGHIDIIKRALKLFDKVIVLVAINPNKVCRFSIEERVEILKEVCKDIPNVEIDTYKGLTVRYAKEKGAVALIRGIRVLSDLFYEWDLCAANEFIDKDIETVFLMAHQEKTFTSSTNADEFFKNDVDISTLVPPLVVEKYKKKYSK